MWVSLSSSTKLVKNLKWTSIVLGFTNFGVIIIGGAHLICNYSESCSNKQVFPFLFVMVVATVRVFAMFRCAILQQAAAVAVLGSSPDDDDDSNLSRVRRRLRYKKWRWWTRFATIVTVVQFLLALYLMFMVLSNTSSYECALVSLQSNGWWKRHLLVIFVIMVCFVVTLQCFASSDVLRWRSFYDMQDTAWKAHYQEVFDHGIREALCCMGHVKYLANIEEDEVNSVAQLLGDLVTYRASGTGHLEFLAGLILLQMHNQSPKLDANSVDAPEDKIQEATAFYHFAEAAYTGPLLDIGRNPILFPCAWLYRQGLFTAWSHNRRPVLQGDNWWRGHAAAFLKYANLPPESLRRGRVNQGKCQAAYFIVVLHNIRAVVIAVRGTETPEDLITDGLCRETTLTMEDLDGLINSRHIDPTTRQTVLSSFPHYGHSGIVESARELYHQIEGAYSGTSGITAFETSGFLSSLLGAGCECNGYAVRIVGHSLGGAIGALLGIRLYGKIPNLQVYAYGPLPCVDSIIADACTGFITSIVHDTEFSSFLSVNSILRLRAAALTTLSHSSTTDTAMISKLAQLFLNVSKNGKVLKPPDPIIVGDATQRCTNDDSYGRNIGLGSYAFLHDGSRINEAGKAVAFNLLEDLTDSIVSDETLVDDPVSQFLEAVPSSVSRSPGHPPEVFLPGLVIHLIRRQRGINFPLLKGWGAEETEPPYKAIVAERENFKEILISPSMFLDHFPWRCHYALQSVRESQKTKMDQDDLHLRMV